MTNIPQYFFSTDTEKQTLHRRIIPNKDQQDNQQIKWNDLYEFISIYLKDKTDYQITSWLQGSYKFGTQVKPTGVEKEFDIDLGVYFIWTGKSNDGVFSPKQLKDYVYSGLLEFQKNNNDVIKISPPKPRCSRIHFTDSFHIDIPCYHFDEENDYRELATESNEWEISDPQAFYSWFLELFPEGKNSQVKRIIQYLKIWSHLKINTPPSSMLLTVLVSEAYTNCNPEELEGDDVALKTIIEKIISRLEIETEILNPVNADENINRLNEDDFDIFIDHLKKLLNIAEHALENSSEAVTALIWSEAFLHFFPIPEYNLLSSSEKTIMPMLFVPEVAITAIGTKNTNLRYRGLNKIENIPRDCDITFTLTNCQLLPEGAKIKWMVRNEGAEAEYVNDLGHPAGDEDDQYTSNEHSLYVGKHYMDVMVTSAYGAIIGYRRIPVEISGWYAPPRNKPRSYHGPK